MRACLYTACPKGLNPALAIAKIKKEIRELPKEDNRGVLSSSVHSHNPGPGGEIDKDVFDRY